MYMRGLRVVFHPCLSYNHSPHVDLNCSFGIFLSGLVVCTCDSTSSVVVSL